MKKKSKFVISDPKNPQKLASHKQINFFKFFKWKIVIMHFPQSFSKFSCKIRNQRPKKYFINKHYRMYHAFKIFQMLIFCFLLSKIRHFEFSRKNFPILLWNSYLATSKTPWIPFLNHFNGYFCLQLKFVF